MTVEGSLVVQNHVKVWWGGERIANCESTVTRRYTGTVGLLGELEGYCGSWKQSGESVWLKIEGAVGRGRKIGCGNRDGSWARQAAQSNGRNNAVRRREV